MVQLAAPQGGGGGRSWGGLEERLAPQTKDEIRKGRI